MSITILNYFGVHSGRVGWSTVVQARRWWFPFPMGSLGFFIDWILLTLLWPWD